MLSERHERDVRGLERDMDYVFWLLPSPKTCANRASLREEEGGRINNRHDVAKTCSPGFRIDWSFDRVWFFVFDFLFLVWIHVIVVESGVY